mgnify:CR=1 FL=1
MAFNTTLTNQKIKDGFGTGQGAKFSKRRWDRIASMTGYNQWFAERAFTVPDWGGKQDKIKMITLKCPQHVVDVVDHLFHARSDWIKYLPKNSDYEAYKGAARPPNEGDLYVDTLWPWTANWEPRHVFDSDVKKRYQIIRFLKSGKTDSSGANVSAAAMTKLQETGSAIVFRHIIVGDLKNPKSAKDIAKHKKCRADLDAEWMAIAGVPCDMGWIENFYKQQKALLVALDKYPGGNDFEEFQRDGPFMDFIMKEVIGTKESTLLGIKGKDNWNPADIWLIKKQSTHIKNLKKLMSTPQQGYTIFRKRLFAAKIDQFNAEMRALFKDKEIWGISLKLVTQKEAKWEFVNVEDSYFKALQSKEFKVGTGQYAPTCKLSTNTDDGAELFDSQDSILWVLDGDAQYKFQIKANTSTKRDNLKYEATQKGFGAARLGKATAEYVEGLIDAYRNAHGDQRWREFKKSNKDYPYSADELLNGVSGRFGKEEIIEMAKFLNSEGVDLNIKPEDAYDRMVGARTSKPFVVNSKVMQMAFLCTVLSIKKNGDNNLNEFLTDLVFMSKKEGKQYGPFLKLY